MQPHRCPESGSGCGERLACLQPQVPWLWKRPWPGLSAREERCPWFQSTCNPTIIVLLEVESHPAKSENFNLKKNTLPWLKKRLKSHTHTHTHTNLPRLKKEEQEAALVHARVHAVRSSAETDHLAFCRGEATGRPQPGQACRPRAPAPSPERWGCPHSEAGGVTLGAGSIFGAQAAGPRGARGSQGPAHSPDVPLKEGRRGLRAFCLRSSPPQGPGAWPPAAGTGPPRQGRGGRPRAAAAFQIPRRLEPAQPRGPGWLLSPHKQTRSVSLGAGSRVCGEMGSGVPMGADVLSAAELASGPGDDVNSQQGCSASSEPRAQASRDRAGHSGLPPSAVHVDEKDVLVRAVAGPGLLEVADAGAAHSVSVCRVVVEDAAGGPAVAAQHDEVALVVG